MSLTEIYRKIPCCKQPLNGISNVKFFVRRNQVANANLNIRKATINYQYVSQHKVILGTLLYDIFYKRTIFD